MTAAQDVPPGTIPSRAWRDADLHQLRVLPTIPGDECVIATTYDRRRDTRADVAFSSAQLREMAADFVERADQLDNVAGRNRRTPAWHIREGERFLTNARRDTSASDADVLALVASAHFQAAVALQGRTQVVNHLHTDQSGKDEI